MKFLIIPFLMLYTECLTKAIFLESDPPIEVIGGFDGANPQSQESIISETTHRFRIKPFNEEGSNDSYYFRFNTKIINHTSKTQGVELIIECPALKSHADFIYNSYWYGDIGNWQWTYASIEGVEAKINIPLPPGTTYVGFFPRYSYEYFDQFMENLGQDQDLKKWIEGKSFYGRNIWHLKITDADVPDENKNRILITARNHGYETGGSYIAEEIIQFLKSTDSEAQTLKRENIIYLIPMLNPDGVALGMNQRTRPNGVNLSYGVGTVDPALITLLETVDKIKPTLWADIHSWPHKNDDGLYATHKWVAEGLLEEIPHKSFNDYVWNISFVKERNPAENHLWQWLLRTQNSAGVSLSMSWFRRSEEDIRKIGLKLIQALGKVANKNP